MRRNKRNEKCNWDWKNHDEHFREHISREVGCTPPHWYSNTTRRPCSKQQQLSRFDNKFHDRIIGSDFFIKPCLEIEKMFYRFDEIRGTIWKSLTNYIAIVILFQDTIYKEIDYVKGMETLVNLKLIYLD